MNIFEDPTLGLKKIGKLKIRNSREIKSSRLSVGFESLDRAMFKPEPCYGPVGALGVKYARCQTAWVLCEKEKGIYTFEWLDQVVDSLLNQGVEPWFNLTFGNPLYMPDIPNQYAVGCIPNLFGEECLNAWYQFVEALTKHFFNRVHLWEIWNEPNHPGFWYPSKPSAEKYVEFCKQTVPHIKKIDPSAKIAGCSAGIASKFILTCMQVGLGDVIDYFSVHPYGSVIEHEYMDQVKNLRRTMKKYAPHVKIMQGECGYPSQTYGHQDRNLSPYHATEETQAKYVIRRVMIDSAAEMELISYFHIADFMENVYRQASGAARPPVMLGLLHGKTYMPKKAYYAMQNVSQLFDNETIHDDLFFSGWMMDYNLRAMGALPSLAKISATFLRHGYGLYGWYMPEDLQKEWCGNVTFQVTILPGETEKTIDDPVVIDCLTGDVFEVLQKGNDNYGQLVFNALPIADYPIFLTDRKAIELELLRNE